MAEALVELIKDKVQAAAFKVRAGIELHLGQRKIDKAIKAGFADEKAVKLLEEHPDVKRVQELEMLYETSGDEDLHQQLQTEKQKLSNAQLIALTRLNERRMRKALR